MTRKMCLNITYEMLEAYKIKTLDDAKNGRAITFDGETKVSVPIELLLWLIERTQAWEQMEHKERIHQGNEVD